MIDENLIYEAQRMLHERCVYYKQAASKATDKELKTHYSFSAFAYSSACDILLAAVQGNAEILKQFDYFGKDK